MTDTPSISGMKLTPYRYTIPSERVRWPVKHELIQDAGLDLEKWIRAMIARRLNKYRNPPLFIDDGTQGTPPITLIPRTQRGAITAAAAPTVLAPRITEVTCHPAGHRGSAFNPWRSA